MTDEKRPAFDLRIYQPNTRHKYGSVEAMVTWSLNTGEPCIVMVPARENITFERTVPCVIPMSMAWVWAEETGDARHCARSAFGFAQNLGFNPHDSTILFQIHAIVRDMLQDLVLCPPLPPDGRQKVADIVVTDNATGRIVEKEISDHV